eukprot:scaffold2224_cov261-Pinguiococcus_pyrenoidosus.AAC.41
MQRPRPRNAPGSVAHVTHSHNVAGENGDRRLEGPPKRPKRRRDTRAWRASTGAAKRYQLPESSLLLKFISRRFISCETAGRPRAVSDRQRNENDSTEDPRDAV